MSLHKRGRFTEMVGMGKRGSIRKGRTQLFFFLSAEEALGIAEENLFDTIQHVITRCAMS